MPVKGKPAAKPAPVAKSYNKAQCLKDAKTRLNWNNMGCGTDPDPANSFCYRKNVAEYQKQADFCGKM